MKTNAAVHMKIWSLVDVSLLLYNVGRVMSGASPCSILRLTVTIVRWRRLSRISGMVIPTGSGVRIGVPLRVGRIMRICAICVPRVSTVYGARIGIQ